MNGARLILGVLVLPAILFAGCKAEAREGPQVGTVVGYQHEGILARSGPHAIQVDVGGQRRTLDTLFDDAAILVFTNEACLPADSGPVRTSHWLDYRIPIIEVSSSSEGCEAVRQCAAARGEKGNQVISLCDPLGFVRGWYGVTGPTAVLVLDDDGYVISAGTLKDFDYLRLRAEDQAERDRKDRQSRLYGGRR
jgi:hypothetical protein